MGAVLALQKRRYSLLTRDLSKAATTYGMEQAALLNAQMEAVAFLEKYIAEGNKAWWNTLHGLIPTILKPHSPHAEELTKLLNDDVDAFIVRATALYAGKHGYNVKELNKYLNQTFEKALLGEESKAHAKKWLGDKQKFAEGLSLAGQSTGTTVCETDQCDFVYVQADEGRMPESAGSAGATGVILRMLPAIAPPAEAEPAYEAPAGVEDKSSEPRMYPKLAPDVVTDQHSAHQSGSFASCASSLAQAPGGPALTAATSSAHDASSALAVTSGVSTASHQAAPHSAASAKESLQFEAAVPLQRETGAMPAVETKQDRTAIKADEITFSDDALMHFFASFKSVTKPTKPESTKLADLMPDSSSSSDNSTHRTQPEPASRSYAVPVNFSEQDFDFFGAGTKKEDTTKTSTIQRTVLFS